MKLRSPTLQVGSLSAELQEAVMGQSKFDKLSFNLLSVQFSGFPGGASGKDPAWKCRRLKRHRLDPWVRKIPGSGRSPGEGMATYASILAWRTPWTKELCGLQSIGSQRVGHD